MSENNSNYQNSEDPISQTAPVPQDALRQVFSSLNDGSGKLPANDKRKSLGRRVSFAATAKVRVFDKEKEKAHAPGNDEEEDELISGERRMSFVNDENDPFGVALSSARNGSLFPASPAAVQSKANDSPGRDSVSSFEVDVKEGTDMSLIAEEEEVVAELDDDDEDEVDGMSMDFTQAVGRMSNISAASMDITQVVSPGRPSMDASMDFTTCVGGLLQSPAPPKRNDVQVDEPEEQVRFHAQKSIEHLLSPSPFWPASPKPNSAGKVALPMDSPMIIDKEERPAAFSFTASPMAIDSPVKPPTTSAATNSLTDDLFKQFINQDQIISNSVKTSAVASPKSSRIGENLVRANLKDFLNVCGIRFLDNLTSLTRRETNSRPRDSTISSVPGRGLAVMAASVPEAEQVDRAAQALVQKILGTKDCVEALESQFGIAPPQFYLHVDLEKETDQASLRLKTLKSVSRLVAKQEWYQWRRLALESHVNNQMEKNFELLLAVESQADAAIEKLSMSEEESQLEALEKELSEQVRVLRKRIQSSADVKERQRAQEISKDLTQVSSAISQLNNEIEALSVQESSLRSAISNFQDDKRTKQGKIEACKRILAEKTDISEASLQEIKSQVALHCAITGWRWVSIKPEALVLEWQRAGPVHIRFELCQPGAVKAVQINSSAAASRILKHSSRLIKVDAGHSIPKVTKQNKLLIYS